MRSALRTGASAVLLVSLCFAFPLIVPPQAPSEEARRAPFRGADTGEAIANRVATADQVTEVPAIGTPLEGASSPESKETSSVSTEAASAPAVASTGSVLRSSVLRSGMDVKVELAPDDLTPSGSATPSAGETELAESGASDGVLDSDAFLRAWQQQKSNSSATAGQSPSGAARGEQGKTMRLRGKGRAEKATEESDAADTTPNALEGNTTEQLQGSGDRSPANATLEDLAEALDEERRAMELWKRMPSLGSSVGDTTTWLPQRRSGSSGGGGGSAGTGSSSLGGVNSPGSSGGSGFSGGGLGFPGGGGGGGGGRSSGNAGASAPLASTEAAASGRGASTGLGGLGTFSASGASSGISVQGGAGTAPSDPSKFGIPNAQYWKFSFTDRDSDGDIDRADAEFEFNQYLNSLDNLLDNANEVVKYDTGELNAIYKDFNDQLATSNPPKSPSFVTYMIIEFPVKGFYLPQNQIPNNTDPGVP